MNIVSNPHPIKVSVPGSKSITNRALLIAALANGKSQLKGVLFSDDSRHFVQALIDLGFPVDVDESKKEITITGEHGQIPCVVNGQKIETACGVVNADIYVGSAGTAARFLTAFLGLSNGRFRMDASEQMRKRPMKELLIALEELGADIIYEEEPYHFPFVIGNSGIKKDEIIIDVDKSSQFLSALLISSVLFTRDFCIRVVGHHGMAYVKMTVEMMKQFGADVKCQMECENDTARFFIQAKEHYASQDYAIEPDLSAACYFYAMAPILKVSSVVLGVPSNSLQGDIAFLDVLKDMGCKIEMLDGEITVFPPENGVLKGGSWDLSTFSDQALTLAALAPFADGEVQIQNVSHIRLQECDRIHAIIKNLETLGIRATEQDGTITIETGDVHGGLIETFEDHRVAMSFSLPGLVIDGVEIENPMCCRKTFENYFDVLEEEVY